MSTSRMHAELKTELGRRAAFCFARRNCAVQKSRPYVLADPSRWPDNMVLDEVAQLVVREKGRRPLRLSGQLHNGLNSQALLFNLVGPLVVRNDAKPLQRTLAAKGLAWDGDIGRARLAPEDCFPADEDARQPLPADLLVAGRTAPDLIVATRLADRGFDGCPIFERGLCRGENPSAAFLLCPRHLAGWTGWNLLLEWGLLGPAWQTKTVCPLARSHQFFLAALLVRQRNGLLLLLCDQRNPVFFSHGSRNLLAELTSLLPPVLQASIVAVGVQELFQSIKASGRHDDWIDGFAEKYGMPADDPVA